MDFDHIPRFLRKSREEKRLTLRHFTRIKLSMLPYVPVRTRLPLDNGEAPRFWWSYVDSMFQADRKFGDYWGQDLGELRFLWNALGPGMAAFDVGAHHGIYSIVAAKRVGATGRVVAFEPSPAEVSRLKLHLWLNRVSNVTVESIALSNSPGQAEFFRVLEGYKGRSGLRFPLFPDTPSPVKQMKVEVTTLDEYVAQHGVERLDLMKLDVEGAELDVLRGGSRVLSTLRPMALCEIWDYVTQPWGHSARAVIEFLQASSYRWFAFETSGALFPHQPQDAYTEVKNYLAVPEEKLAAVQNWVRPQEVQVSP